MKKLYSLPLVLVLAVAVVFAGYYQPVSAVTASDWRAGRIIDDAIFENPNEMSVADIQNFLNNRIYGGSCDTYGQRTLSSAFWAPDYNGDGRTTNAEYAKYRGYGDNHRFTCLKDYYEVTKTEPGPNLPVNNYGQYNADGSPVIPAGSKSAAQLIYDAAQKYRINPKALLVKLATESAGPLTSDDWPFPRQYNFAMGAHCPDSGPGGSPNCDPNYAGFSIQMNEAADLLRWYLDSMTQKWWTYKRPGQVNSILWNVAETGCGAADVLIESKATAALYTYTPYQPNEAALRNMYGTGDGCSAYGNRNFWRVWNDWFGSTSLAGVNIESPLSIGTIATGDKLFTGMNITAQFTIKNNTGQRQDIGTMAIAVRSSANTNHDFGSRRVILEPWQTYQFAATTVLAKEDNYTFYITNYRDSVGWDDNFPLSIGLYKRSLTTFVQSAPIVTTPILSSINKLHVGQPTTISFDVKNTSAKPIDLGYFGIAISDPTNNNADLQFDTVREIAPNSTYKYSKTFIPNKTGTYKARISATLDGGKIWSEGLYPVPSEASGNNRLTLTVYSNPTLTQGITFESTDIRSGEPVTGTFKVKNFSDQQVVVNKNACVIVRGSNGGNYDLGCLPVTVMQPNQELEFKASRAFPAGTYRAYFSMYENGNWQDHKTFPLETGNEVTGLELKVKPSVTVTQGLSVDKDTVRSGDIVTGSFKIKNFSRESVSINERLCYIIRGPDWRNHDLGCMDIGTLTSGEAKTFSVGRKFSTPGKYTAFFALNEGSVWRDNAALPLETGTEPMKSTFTVTPNPTLVQGLTFSNTSPKSGDLVEAAFKLKNHSGQPVSTTEHTCFIIRNQQGANYDLGCLSPSTIQPGQELEFKVVRSFPPGIYNAYFSTFDDKVWQDYKAPPLETGQEAVRAEMRVSN